jgi:hypothetical protein
MGVTQTFSTKSLAAILVLALCASCQGQKSATYTEVVNKATTTTGVAASASASNVGQQITYTASIGPAKPTIPTGSVVFTATGINSAQTVTSAAILVSGNGLASWSETLPAVDTYTVSAVYSGDANYLGSTGTGTETVVGQQDFSLSLPPSITVTRGQAGSGVITLTPINGFSGTVTLTCGGMPYESGCNFANSSVALTSSLPGQNSASSQSGSATVQTALNVTTTGVTVTTTGALIFLFGLGGMRKRRTFLWPCVCLAILTGMAALSGCAGGNRYVQNNGTPPGSYSVTVTAVSGSITHTGTTTLVVAAQ